MFDRLFQMAVMRIDVERQVDFFLARVRVFDRFFDRLAIEIIDAHPQGKIRHAGIHRVRAVMKSIFHLLQIARRSEQFDFFCHFCL